MASPSRPSAPQPFSAGRASRTWWLAGVIVVGCVAAYANSLRSEFVYDDVFAIVDNPTIRHLWPIWAPFSPPSHSGLPVSGRPLVNFSLALNYACTGLAPWGYHLTNLAIHALAALALFGCLRRTLLRLPHFSATKVDSHDAEMLAASIALLWALHPLQTESVSYVSQRAESLMGLLYLLTGYGFIRSIGSTASRRWQVMAVLACLAGMATKEVMVSAPLIVWLYDRTFISGSFTEAWKKRRGFYVGLAASWLVLIGCLLLSGSRGGTAGFDTAVPWWAYALTQARAVTVYLRLVLWPSPLVFDYGPGVVTHIADVTGYLVLVALLVGAVLIGVRKNLWIGFLGAAFFAILAPSSSVVPVATEPLAEHRMYLPLAAVITIAAVALHSVLGRRTSLAVFALALVAGVATWHRNRAYVSEFALWSDTVEKHPDNPRALFSLGVQYFNRGDIAKAIEHYQLALKLRPDFASAHSNLASALLAIGDLPSAQHHAETALRFNPDLAEAHANLGGVLFREGHPDAALPYYQRALEIEPNNAVLHSNLGSALSALGQLTEAEREYEKALALRPNFADARFYLGNTLARLGRFHAAAEQYEAALKVNPNFTAARDNLSRVEVLAKRSEEPVPAP